MAETRPPCPQCATPNPAVVEFGLFALPDARVDELLSTGFDTPANYVWQCQSCRHEWGV